MTEIEIKNRKHRIIGHLLAEKQAALQRLVAEQKAELAIAGEIQGEEEDFGGSGKIEEAIEMAEAKTSTMKDLRAQVELLSNLELIEATPEIQLADIVETDRGNFFVAVPAEAFEVDGVHYRGISTESPLFIALKGKHDGDKVMVNGNPFQLITSY